MNSPAGTGPWLDAWALESAIKPSSAWTIFARAEATATNDLGTPPGVVATVGKTSIGAIHEAGDGEEALERMRNHRVCMVLTDINMPKLDGFGFIERVREDETYRATPILDLPVSAAFAILTA